MFHYPSVSYLYTFVVCKIVRAHSMLIPQRYLTNLFIVTSDTMFISSNYLPKLFVPVDPSYYDNPMLAAMVCSKKLVASFSAIFQMFPWYIHTLTKALNFKYCKPRSLSNINLVVKRSPVVLSLPPCWSASSVKHYFQRR